LKNSGWKVASRASIFFLVFKKKYTGIGFKVIWIGMIQHSLDSQTQNTCCVADPGCLSRIPDPDFLPIPDPGSRIPDPKTATKERGEKIGCHTLFFKSHKFHKIENYFIFYILKKKMWASFHRIIELSPKNLSLSSKKYGAGIRKKT
jgi:hypothetical protein